jgi:hypothetical protein
MTWYADGGALLNICLVANYVCSFTHVVYLLCFPRQYIMYRHGSLTLPTSPCCVQCHVACSVNRASNHLTGIIFSKFTDLALSVGV